MTGRKGIGVSVLAGVLGLAACSTSNRIEKAQEKEIANISQIFKEEKPKLDTTALPKFITYVDDQGQSQTIMSAVKDSTTGEYISSVELAEVTVVAKAKSIPERNGRVNLDFIVRIPQTLLKKDWKVVFVPLLDNAGEVSRLDSIRILGEEWQFMDERHRYHERKKMQRRLKLNTVLADRVGGRFSKEYRDSMKNVAERQYRTLVERQDTPDTGIRLDTIIDKGNVFEYHYRHSFPTNDMATKLKLYFDAYVMDLNESSYALAQGDTLSYFISSMMQFLDRTPRYRRKLIYRRVTESLTADILFHVGRHEVIDTLGNNAQEFERIRTKMKEINEGNEFVIDSIVLTASCSPEGSAATNALLARNRSEALKAHLAKVLATNPEAVDGLRTHSVPEDWARTREMVRTSREVREADAIIRIIDTVEDLDEREARIRGEYPDDYGYIREHIYPALRHVDFNFCLARRNMVEEYKYSDVIDTDYADALKLMDRRKYKEAMAKLMEYEDWNAAICFMSLGYNQRAYDLFAKEKETADREYMMAILAARLGRHQEAVERYIRCCKLDESKIMRGELDPEISELIKKYNLNDVVGW